MSPKYKLIAILLMIYFPAESQISFYYGIISPEERNMKECSFDPDANAMIILHDAMSSYSDDGELITNHHIRIKILKEKGISNADIAIYYHSEDDIESIVDIEAMVVNYDENGQRQEQSLDRKSVYKKAINKKVSAIKFAFPSVKIGSIIEYTYRSIKKSATMLRDWYFQEQLPVMDSKYVIFVHPRLQFTYQVYRSPGYNVDVQSDPSSAKVSFEMKNIPGLNDEPYMDSREDYLQRVSFQLSGYVSNGYTRTNVMSSWDGLAREILNDSQFGTQLGKDLPGTEEFIKVTKAETSDFDKMKDVYNYVRANMSWTGSNTWWTPDGLKSAWSKKNGTSGDINLILVNLLREVGVEANPMLVSERYNGKVNTSYPFVDQFNTVYAAVEISGKKYFLDATSKYTPVGVIPRVILNTTAFVVRRRSPGLITIADDALQYRTTINILSKVDADGSVKGEALVSNDGYARIERVAEYKTNNEKYIESNFRQALPAVSITDFEVTNADIDSLPLKNKFHFSLPANKNGDYVIVPYNLFSGYESNPFIANTRFSTVNFGWRQTITLNTSTAIPANMKVDVMPKSIKMTNSDNSITFTRQAYPDDGSGNIVIRTKIEFTKTEFPADEYANLKEFYKKMFELLNEQIVLKKK